MRGKIVKGIAGFYYVHVPSMGRIIACKARGVFRNQNKKPLVGDDVEIAFSESNDGEGTIQELLPRCSDLIRPAVANVDQAVVLFAAVEPEPNLNLLDRFLVYLERQEIPAIVCFNKSDLAGEEQLETLRQTYAGCGYPVYTISVRRQKGIEELKQCFAGKTTVLAGPSGVGKSSLTNLLIPEAEMETGKISEKIKRGKHTTRHSELFFLDLDPVYFKNADQSGELLRQSYLMDTPGFASLELFHLEKEELWHYFKEFELYEPYCRFQGCVHIGERECGVKEALVQGEIAESRYRSYQQFYEELRQQKK